MEEKHCPQCGKLKSKNQFSIRRKNKDGLQNLCKECKRKYDRDYFQEHKENRMKLVSKRKQETREWFQDYLQDKKCMLCGFDHLGALEFHHRDPSKKFDTICNMVSKKGYSKAKIMIEINKCDILCANCHNILHWKERQK